MFDLKNCKCNVILLICFTNRSEINVFLYAFEVLQRISLARKVAILFFFSTKTLLNFEFCTQ